MGLLIRAPVVSRGSFGSTEGGGRTRIDAGRDHGEPQEHNIGRESVRHAEDHRRAAPQRDRHKLIVFNGGAPVRTPLSGVSDLDLGPSPRGGAAPLVRSAATAGRPAIKRARLLTMSFLSADSV